MNISKINNISLSDQIIEAKEKEAAALKERERKLTIGAGAVYQIEKYTADTLIQAKQVGKNSFLLPNMSLTVKLKEGKRLIDFVEKYMTQKYKGHFNSVVVNKSIWGAS